MQPTRENALADNLLVNEFRRGNDEAAKVLFERYSHRLNALAEQYCNAGYAPRFEADDIVQSVFRIFFEGVRTSAYDVPTNGELWGLLMVLALNKIRGQVDHHTAAKRDVNRTTPLTIPADTTRHVSYDMREANLRMDIEEQIEMLTPAHRPVVRLRMQGYEVQEISDRCGCSRRTVERVLQEFRERVRSFECI